MEACSAQRSVNMEWRCGVLFLLNVLDSLITTFASLEIESAYEANPLWAFVIAASPWLFCGLKIALGSFLIYLLYRCESEHIKRYGSTLCIALYSGIVFHNWVLVAAVTSDMFF